MSSAVIPHIVGQHADEASNLFIARAALADDAPHARLRDLYRFDERLSAHLDGLQIAGDYGVRISQAALSDASAGSVFVAAVLAIQQRRPDLLDKVFSVSEAVPESGSGLVASFAWVSASELQGLVSGLLESAIPFRRAIAVAACAAHRVDPGKWLTARLSDPEPQVLLRAIQATGELGCCHLDATLTPLLRSGDMSVVRAATYAGALLGAGPGWLERFGAFALAEHGERDMLLRVAMQSTPAAAGRDMLTRLSEDTSLSARRRLVASCGLVGDPYYVPWLIRQMADAELARLAAESFCLITGVDLRDDKLEGMAPPSVESKPTDEPDDADPTPDPDADLRWPDGTSVQRWWESRSAAFQQGIRHFMGQPVNKQHCIHVLKTGYQRQRILAAHYLCLLEPGTPLFNTSAPAWRQQRLLAAM